MPTTSLMQRNRTIAFRLDSEAYAQAIAFKDTFPERQWGEAMRWLLEDPTVQAVMRDRILAATRPSRHTQPASPARDGSG